MALECAKCGNPNIKLGDVFCSRCGEYIPHKYEIEARKKKGLQ